MEHKQPITKQHNITDTDSELDAVRAKMSGEEKEAYSDLIRLYDKKKEKLNSDIGPELALAAVEAGANTVRIGTQEFAAWLNEIVKHLRVAGFEGDQIKELLPELKRGYASIAATPEDYAIAPEATDQMTTPSDIRNVNIEAIVSEVNDALSGYPAPQANHGDGADAQSKTQGGVSAGGRGGELRSDNRAGTGSNGGVKTVLGGDASSQGKRSDKGSEKTRT